MLLVWSATERAVDAAEAVLLMSGPLFFAFRQCRRTKRYPILWRALTIYAALLLTAFVFGILVDDGFGVAFVPLMLITAPWSFFLQAFGGVHSGFEQSALLQTFLLLVVVCGGLNALLLSLVVRRNSKRDITVIGLKD